MCILIGSPLLILGQGVGGQMGMIYHAATLPLYKNATDAKLENTPLSADVFIRAA